jgi:uncharacterized protein (TIGR03067 family)
MQPAFARTGSEVSPMRRLSIFTALVLAAAGAATAGDPARGLDALKGTWELVELTERGKKLDDKKGMKLTISGNAATVEVGGKEIGRGTIKVDPARKPKTMELTKSEGDKSVTVKGVYEIDGDTLRFCHFDGEKSFTDYPPKVEATEHTTLAVLKRVK